MQRTEYLREKLDPVQDMAMLIAIVTRNAMEEFHCDHLSDSQMKELNPIIRNAVYTALLALRSGAEHQCKEIRRRLESEYRMIPEYWEKPEILDGWGFVDQD